VLILELAGTAFVGCSDAAQDGANGCAAGSPDAVFLPPEGTAGC